MLRFISIAIVSLAGCSALFAQASNEDAREARYNHDAYGERPDGSNYDGPTGAGRLSRKNGRTK